MTPPSVGSHRPSERPLPRKFGRYMLFDAIGRGGMADLYLGRTTTDLGAARLVVVKQILEEYAHQPQFAEMLIHEAKLAARLSHANVVQVLDLGREGGHLFLAMEYVEGFDLNALLRRCSKQKVPLPLEFALHVVVSALRGLDYAHRRSDDAGRPLGIVHRDVSPSNILISFEGEVKLCDFGIAHASEVAANARSPMADEAIKGKAGYMSPEHARGEVIDARADVFAVGIVLWELLCGRRLYRHEAPPPGGGSVAPPPPPSTKSGLGTGGRSSLLEQARRANIPPLPLRGVAMEATLHAIVGRALARDKNERYASAGAMLRDLEAWANAAGKLASPLKFGQWLSSNFGAEVIEQRRSRERAAAALAKGPLVVLTPLAPLSLVAEMASASVDADDDTKDLAVPEPRAASDSATDDEPTRVRSSTAASAPPPPPHLPPARPPPPPPPPPKTGAPKAPSSSPSASPPASASASPSASSAPSPALPAPPVPPAPPSGGAPPLSSRPSAPSAALPPISAMTLLGVGTPTPPPRLDDDDEDYDDDATAAVASSKSEPLPSHTMRMAGVAPPPAEELPTQTMRMPSVVPPPSAVPGSLDATTLDVVPGSGAAAPVPPFVAPVAPVAPVAMAPSMPPPPGTSPPPAPSHRPGPPPLAARAGASTASRAGGNDRAWLSVLGWFLFFVAVFGGAAAAAWYFGLIQI